MASSISKPKKFLFSLITLAFVLIILELGTLLITYLLPQFGVGRSSSPYIVYKNVQKVFTLRNLNGTEYYVRTQHHPYVLSNIRFRAVKPQKTFRVFCLGGSAALGWPHPPSQSYPAFLAKKLQLLYPEREFEIINVAASTYASYRVKTIFDEIIDYEPDLILLYTGNNEFLERILYPSKSELQPPWNHSALIRTLHQAWTNFTSSKQVIDIENYQPTFMTDIALGNSSPLKVTEGQYQQVVEHYRHNLSSMITAAQKRSVPIVLFTVPVNVRNWQPHASVHQAGLDSLILAQWRDNFAKGFIAFREQQYDEALVHFDKALKADSTHAELQYLTGKSYEYLSKSRYSRIHLLRSLESDAYPFRALPYFNQIIRALSNEHQIPLADIEQTFSNKAKMSIIGEELLVDHVHPTIASNQLIADNVLQTLWNAQVLPGKDEAKPSLLQMPVPSQAEATLPLMQHLFLIYRVLLQFDKIEDLYHRATNLPEYEKNSLQYQEFMDNFNRYLKVMRPYRKLLVSQKTGQAHLEFTPQEKNSIIAEYIKMSRESLPEKDAPLRFSLGID